MTEVTQAAPPKRLPPGRHGLSRELVRESQRRRLTAAAAESLAEHGYGGITVTGVARSAGVSTATLYKRFDDLWACLLAAYEAGAERLCEEIEGACASANGPEGRAAAGIASGLALLDTEPPLATLLSAEPPPQAAALRTARLHLCERLAILLRSARKLPAASADEREARLIAGAMALVSRQARRGEAGQLKGLGPTLTRILLSA